MPESRRRRPFPAQAEERVLADAALVTGDAGVLDAAAVSDGHHVVAGHGHAAHADVAGQETLGRLIRLFVGVLHVDAAQVAEVLRAGFVAVFAGRLGVDGHHVLGALRVGLQVDVGIVVFGGPDQRLRAAQAGNPDRRVRLLDGPLEGH